MVLIIDIGIHDPDIEISEDSQILNISVLNKSFGLRVFYDMEITANDITYLKNMHKILLENNFTKKLEYNKKFKFNDPDYDVLHISQDSVALLEFVGREHILNFITAVINKIEEYS